MLCFSWFRLVDYVYSCIVVMASFRYCWSFISSWYCNTWFIYRQINDLERLLCFLRNFSLLGYTRISDFHHHWHDVCIGAIVGSLVAFVTFKFILNWRHYHPKFLPYTVARITQNDSVHMNHPRRISPEPDNEHNHYF